MYCKWWIFMKIIKFYCACKINNSVTIPNAGKPILSNSRICLYLFYKVYFWSTANWCPFIVAIDICLLELECSSGLIANIVAFLIVQHSKESFLFGKTNFVITIDNTNLFLCLWMRFVAVIERIVVFYIRRLQITFP